MRFLVITICVLSLTASAQVTIQVNKIPSNTPPHSNLFIAGNFNGWNPGDSAFMLEHKGDVYQVKIPMQKEPCKFKITLGIWTSCEGSAEGDRIDDRTITASSDTIIQIEVAGWERQAVSSALPNVYLLNDSFWMPQLNRYRRVWVYLPSSYHQHATERYPVMYMQDGQNVFDDATSFSGEWGVDETLHMREEGGHKGCIVVAVDNGGATRLSEYSPFVNPRYGGGEGDLYVDFLTVTLKPVIDSVYRTQADREHTAIIGSSMGGLISMYAGIKYQQVYGVVGAFSPSFWFSDSLFVYVKNHPKKFDTRWYFVLGAQEGSQMAPPMDKMTTLLLSKGYKKESIIKQIQPNGEHKEWFWKEAFVRFCDWLGFD
jgi:predicted alpha/beta superfamily hydrolase